MGRASTEMETMRRKMLESVDKLSTEDLRAMLKRGLSMAGTYEMREMAAATSFGDFDTLDWDLDLAD